MHPAFSVIFLTTLIGVGQGFFLALFLAEVGGNLEWLPPQNNGFYVVGSVIAFVFLVAGLIASFFHLGRPERAWRAAAMWRTSWLSREVLVLPAFMAAVLAYGAAHHLGTSGTLVIGAVATGLCFALFVCTAMIYACIRFLQEWASPWTLVNFTALGCASGFTLACAYAPITAPALVEIYVTAAVLLTLVSLCTRAASLLRNARIRPKSSLQTAIGVKHPKIVQKAQGFIGSSFNTREFFHGRPASVVRTAKWTFLLLVFPLPTALLVAGYVSGLSPLFALAFAAQYVGLLAERWFFFAQARHPQNLYYQAMS